MITLEAMTQNKEMDTNKIACGLRLYFIISFKYFLFTKFLTTFYHLDKLLVFVNSIAFFKDNWADFIKLFLQS